MSMLYNHQTLLCFKAEVLLHDLPGICPNFAKNRTGNEPDYCFLWMRLWLYLGNCVPESYCSQFMAIHLFELSTIRRFERIRTHVSLVSFVCFHII